MAGTTASITDYWDAAASAFDDEPDHGLRAEQTRTAWALRLRSSPGLGEGPAVRWRPCPEWWN
ncbi:hypothetical protein [Streptomyces sp. NPDC029004]|uniref:hypothetical protein n=1 Tax=Streptomyces sp. NPDC029004 TaxID=3154490 RepID=UPI0033CC8466